MVAKCIELMFVHLRAGGVTRRRTRSETPAIRSSTVDSPPPSAVANSPATSSSRSFPVIWSRSTGRSPGPGGRQRPGRVLGPNPHQTVGLETPVARRHHHRRRRSTPAPPAPASPTIGQSVAVPRSRPGRPTCRPTPRCPTRRHGRRDKARCLPPSPEPRPRPPRSEPDPVAATGPAGPINRSTSASSPSIFSQKMSCTAGAVPSWIASGTSAPASSSGVTAAEPASVAPCRSSKQRAAPPANPSWNAATRSNAVPCAPPPTTSVSRTTTNPASAWFTSCSFAPEPGRRPARNSAAHTPARQSAWSSIPRRWAGRRGSAARRGPTRAPPATPPPARRPRQSSRGARPSMSMLTVRSGRQK